MSDLNKKVVIPVVIVVMTLMILVIGATYAYFNVTTANGVSTVKVSSTAESVGVVSLTPKNNLEINLTTTNMVQGSGNVTYYATTTGTPSSTKVELPIATASVEGNGTINCRYELAVSITGTNNMYTAFNAMTTKSTNQLILTIDGVEYDFFNADFSKNITGSIENLSENNSKDILASFRIVNRSDLDQSDLAGTDMDMSFTVDKFECDLVG